MSNAPSAARAQHLEELEAPRVDATAFRQGWRVRTRLDRLLADGRISAGTWQAAVEYRSAWERVLAQGGAGEPGGWRVGGSVSDPHQRAVSLVATLTRLRLVEEALGGLAADLCRCCVVHDHSWASIARHCHRNPETVRDWAALALLGLATVWGRVMPPGRAARRVDPLQGLGNGISRGETEAAFHVEPRRRDRCGVR